jgi:hypothetical protein
MSINRPNNLQTNKTHTAFPKTKPHQQHRTKLYRLRIIRLTRGDNEVSVGVALWGFLCGGSLVGSLQFESISPFQLSRPSNTPLVISTTNRTNTLGGRYINIISSILELDTLSTAGWDHIFALVSRLRNFHLMHSLFFFNIWSLHNTPT